jgi:defect-in-organelle-trafficking protein DotB
MTPPMTGSPFAEEPLRFTIQDIDKLLVYLAKELASDITLQSGEFIFAEIYGRLIPVTQRRLTHNEICDILNDIYGANGTAQIMSGKDIDSHYEIKPNRSERYRFRINGTGCQIEGHIGIQITARTIPSDPPLLSTMELPPVLVEALAPEQGVVYVTGSTGSGKTTLLAAIIRDLAEQVDSNRKILTYESPIEFVYDRLHKPSCIVSQSEIPRNLPSFAAGVRNALRRKPRLILVGETRDNETINAVLEAAMTGHPVYTTLHSNGVAETIRRLVTSFSSEERSSKTIDIFETIRVVIWQKLIPTTDGKRIALREYLIFSEEIRDKLLNADIDKVTLVTRQLLRQYGHTMLQEAERYFHEGLITARQLDVIAKYEPLTDTPSTLPP